MKTIPARQPARGAQPGPAHLPRLLPSPCLPLAVSPTVPGITSLAGPFLPKEGQGTRDAPVMLTLLHSPPPRPVLHAPCPAPTDLRTRWRLPVTARVPDKPFLGLPFLRRLKTPTLLFRGKPPAGQDVVHLPPPREPPPRPTRWKSRAAGRALIPFQ